jgi:hypothetical protein
LICVSSAQTHIFFSVSTWFVSAAIWKASTINLYLFLNFFLRDGNEIRFLTLFVLFQVGFCQIRTFCFVLGIED